MSKAKKGTNAVETNESELSKKYQKLTQREHVLARPGMYVGPVKPTSEMLDIFNAETEQIEKQKIQFSPAFFKILDELIINARDHQVREESVRTIKISFSQEEGWIRVFNDGPGIEVKIHPEHKIWIVELIFGHLLTSSNYDDEEKRVVGGLNGLGAKLCNIYSTKFIVETVDTKVGKKFRQEFRNNMLEKDEPVITKVKTGEASYTEITYYPDFKRFGMTELTDTDIAWIQKRAYDIAACTRDNVKVYVNDELINIKNFKDYISIYYPEPPQLVYREIGRRWKVGIIYAPDDGNHHVSFVNAIDTYKGGTHVNYIMDQIVDKTIEQIKKKTPFPIKPMMVKQHLDLFVDATIENPDFPSQTKSELTTKVSQFGSKCEIPDEMMKELFKTDLVDTIISIATSRAADSLNKTDGKKQSNINVDKLVDARLAGKGESLNCRLILTEGDSAKTFAVNGLKVIGQDRYGVFPLRGKLLNVRNATLDQIKKNKEINDLKQIMGLQQGVKYTDKATLKKLRYGGILILTDSDEDGIHIRGLIINLFQYFWPELLKIDGFIRTLSTPLIKVFKKSDKNKKDPIKFYSENDFNKWTEENDPDKWVVRYYKGLGSSQTNEQIEAFQDYDNRVVSFVWESIYEKTNSPKSSKKLDSEDDENEENDDEDDDEDEEEVDDAETINSKNQETTKKKRTKKGKISLVVTDPEITNSKSYNAITLGFDEDRADERKGWLRNHDKNDVLEYTNTTVTYSDFINKDLIHFSNSDIVRSIPSVMDGLKPSQRKILHVCLKDKIKNSIKVSQLASKVAEKTAYKHGEVSLEGTIVGMAQYFPGSNNINLLVPEGTFGSRANGGKSHASSRYIFTYLESITEKIFNKYDTCILTNLREEGETVEPEFYYPILPMILVNGASGIGTGFSTNIPQYNPLDICQNLLKRMDGEEMDEMIPWYNGFTGTIEEEASHCYKVFGKYDITGQNTVKITEIPVVGLYSAIDDYEQKIIKPLMGVNIVNSKAEIATKDKKKDAVVTRKKKEIPVILSGYSREVGSEDNVEDVVDFELQFVGNELQNIVKRGGTEFEDIFKLTSKISTKNMHLYDSKGVIKKYDNVLDIIEDFYKARLKAYVKRREYHMRELENEIDILKYKVKFIKDYLSRTIKLEKEKRERVIEQLVTLKYPKLHTSIEASPEKRTYDYITSMQLFSLTIEKIEELENEYRKKQEEYDDYNSITAEELWKRELNDFIESYHKWLEDKKDRDGCNKTESKKKKKSKTVVTKSKSKK